MSDPLDVVFVTDKDEARRLKRSRQLVALAKYIDSMPMELKPLFKERFSLVDNTELAQLRADADELQRIRELIDPLNGQSVYDAIDALLHDESSAEIYKVEIEEQARQLEAARNLIVRSGRVINNLKKPDSVYDLTSDLLDWLAANPAPPEQQP